MSSHKLVHLMFKSLAPSRLIRSTISRNESSVQKMLCKIISESCQIHVYGRIQMNETNEKLSVGTSVMTAPKAKAEEIDQVKKCAY